MANLVKDIVGQRFGKLVVQKYEGQNKNHISLWASLCDCGTLKTISRASLVSGNAKSCGCLQREHIIRMSYKHGHSPKQKVSSTYKSWAGMYARCKNSNIKAYKDYGGRGIKLCPEWESFECFLRDMGECSAGLTLDRIDVNGDYCPGNCRWATRKEQSNNRRDNRKITYGGDTLNLTQWAERLGVTYNLLAGRFYRGWPVEKLLGGVTCLAG